jgi:predicted P-loop ATPase
MITAAKSKLLQSIAGLPPEWIYTPCGDKKAPTYRNWQNIAYSCDGLKNCFEEGVFAGAITYGHLLLQASKVHAIGVLCGAPSGGLLAFDHDGDSADEVIDKLCGDVEPPPTITVSSGKEGRYCSFYRVPEQYWASLKTTKLKTGKRGPDNKEEALELRWTGAQQVVAGHHPETSGYRWICGPGTPIADAPLWMIEAMITAEPPALAFSSSPSPSSPSPSSPSPSPKLAPKNGSHSKSWRDFEKLPLPFDTLFPLDLGLTKQHQDWIGHGISEGGRNNAAIAIARDLVGVADRLAQWGQRFTGHPQQLFEDFCNRCSPSLTATEIKSTWSSAQRSKKEPCLSDEALANCVRAYIWRQTKPIAPVKPVKVEADRDDDGDEYQGELPKLAREFKAVERAIGDKLKFNSLLKIVELDGQPVSLDDLELDLALTHRVTVDRKNVPLILSNLAMRNAYSPVVDYLNRCGDSYKGNYSAYLQDLCPRILGSVETLHSTYLRRTLISAVARAMEPGCKVDTTLILQGRQGSRKSTFFKMLASADWFDDSMGSYSDKDEKLKLHRAWITEWAELESAFRRRDVSAVKAFLTTATDNLRPPYGREVKAMHRPGIIVGTTNDSAFLSDPTGNRRFWVIPIPHTVDTDAVQAERDQIWGAAVRAYRAGEGWLLSAEEAIASAEDTDNYALKDPWESSLRNYTISRERITIPEFLREQLKFEAKEISPREMMRVAAILSDWQWQKQRVREGTNRNYYWCNPARTPEAAYG